MPSRTKSLIVVLLFLLLAQPNAAQTRSRAIPPDQEPAAPAAPPSEKAPDYSQEAFVVYELKTRYRYEKDGTGKREMGLKVKIQSDAGLKAFGQLVFPYSSANEKLEIDFVRVTKPDGTIVSASESNVQDLSAPIALDAPVYTDLRQKHITVPGLRPGDTLEYNLVSHIHTPFAVNQFWLDHNFIGARLIILKEWLEVNVPADSKIKTKTKPGAEPVISEMEGRRLYTWQRANLKREEEKDEESKQKKVDPEEARKPQVQMTTFQSWDEVGRWYADLERGRSAPDEKVRAKTAEIIKGLDTDKQKVEALYQFVARNFRYVSLSLGQGRYQPHAAAEVLVNQYGDCKDKHTLLSAMLTAAGFRAYPALMNSARKVDPDIPSPGQFDHVISAIPMGSEIWWADTTAEIAPFRLLAPNLRDKKSLLIPDTGLARLETTPATLPFLFMESTDIVGVISDLGKLSGHSKIKVRGDSELAFRLMFRRTPRSEWKHIGSYISSLGSLPAKVSELKASDPAEMDQPFEIEYDFASDDFLDWAGKKANLKLPFPPLNLANVAEKPEEDKPIQLGAPVEINYRLKLTLPQKYQVRVPLPVKIHRDYADYTSTYKLEGQTVVAERTLHLRLPEVPASRAHDYRAFLAAANADEAQTLALETSDLDAPPIPDSAKVEDMIEAAEAAAKNENYRLVEELLKRAVEKEPKHVSARRRLGWALFAQRKLEDAAAVLQAQTKINPFDDYAYNLLGEVHWLQERYVDAEDAFRKQIEVTPLHKWAHANLARLLVERRKYKESIPQLEHAISLNPDSAFLYISLGRAYSNLGQLEKGLEAFDKAIKLTPGAGVWNDVAYNMALSKVHLDKAQQYAESAVSEVATELRNVEVGNLTTQALRDGGRLASFWDTLGWVHFQKGDLDQAERYVAAAWTIGHHGEVGYHMGEILEKRGKKDEAIRMYSLAACAYNPVPETLENLDRLVGKAKREELVKQANPEFQSSRTIRFSAPGVDLKGTKEAQFFVVLTNGPGRKSQVSETTFIRGDEKLKGVAAALKAADFGLVFPNDSATKIIRRGTVFCQTAGGGCSIILLSPEFAVVD